MVKKKSDKFYISDELFFKIFSIFFLIIFGQMIFYLINIRVKKVAENIEKVEEIKNVEDYEKFQIQNIVIKQKMHSIEKRNRKIFGDDYIDKLKLKYAEFKRPKN